MSRITGSCDNFPVILQFESTESGAVSLAMVMEYFKTNIPIETLRDECGVSRDGCNINSLKAVAEKYSFEANVVPLQTIEQICEYSLPSILLMEGNHYVVFTGKKGNQWCIVDPEHGKVFKNDEELKRSFAGFLLDIKPGKQYKKQGKKKSFLSNFLKNLLPAYRIALLIVFVQLLLIPSDIISPNLNKAFIDLFYQKQYNTGVPIVCFGIMVLLIATALVAIKTKLLIYINLRLAVVNSLKFITRLFKLPTEFFVARQPAEIATRVLFNDEIARFLTEEFIRCLSDFMAMLVYSFLLFNFDPLLGSIAIFAAIVTVVCMINDLNKRKLLGGTIKSCSGKIFDISTQCVSSIENVKATSSENAFYTIWCNYYAKLINTKLKLEESNVFVQNLPIAIQKACNALILGIGAIRIIEGNMTMGAFISFQLVLSYFLMPLTVFTYMSAHILDLDASLRRLDDVYNYPLNNSVVQKKESDGSFEGKLSGAVELKNISFGYNPVLPPVIRNINISIKPGEQIAIVGTSGSGKSTFAKLLSGFFKPWTGEILFDGKPRQDYTVEELKYSFAMVDQEILMFPGTIYDNLTIYDKAIPREYVIQGTKDAMIYDTIVSRNNGFYTNFAKSGNIFSGGELQRIEIARALSVSPSILVLDEATSALDAVLEEKITRNIRNRGITTIAIAHRLSTVRDADRIIVLDAGNIAEIGNFNELMNKKGIFFRLVSDLS